MLLSLDALKQTRFEQPLPQSVKFIPAANCERKVDILGASLNGNLSTVVQVKVPRESTDHDARNSDGAESSRHASGELCVQSQFTSL